MRDLKRECACFSEIAAMLTKNSPESKGWFFDRIAGQVLDVERKRTQQSKPQPKLIYILHADLLAGTFSPCIQHMMRVVDPRGHRLPCPKGNQTIGQHRASRKKNRMPRLFRAKSAAIA